MLEIHKVITSTFDNFIMLQMAIVFARVVTMKFDYGVDTRRVLFARIWQASVGEGRVNKLMERN